MNACSQDIVSAFQATNFKAVETVSLGFLKDGEYFVLQNTPGIDSDNQGIHCVTLTPSFPAAVQKQRLRGLAIFA
jgi:hypothetical protein